MAHRLPLAPRSVRWALVALVAATILLLSVTRSPDLARVTGPLGLVGSDKWLHAGAYAGLAAVLAYALAEQPAGRAALLVFLAAVAFGLVVEVIQFGIPYRDFSLLDGVADAAGATLVAVSWRVVGPHLRVRRISGARSRREQ
ncbi:MAG: VanZ family protein [Haloarculaceae archaeon]